MSSVKVNNNPCFLVKFRGSGSFHIVCHGAEIHNVDVPGPSKRDAAALSPTFGILQWPMCNRRRLRRRNRVGSSL